MSELLNIKSLRESRELGVAKLVGNYLKLNWVFETWYEKVILVVLCNLGIWKIIGWIF